MGDQLIKLGSKIWIYETGELKITIGVSINGGTPKWMIYRENPIKIDDLGVPLFQETPKLAS